METAPTLDQRIAAYARTLRAERGLSLEELAARSGISRSMLSLIERGETSPTAVTLEKLATGLGVTMASLFDAPDPTAPVALTPVSRRDDQVEWRDPDSGYRRRNVSPPGCAQPMQIVEVLFPAGARVAFESGVRDAHVVQQVWLLEGRLDVTTGRERYELHPGDCLAMELDELTMFHNPADVAARYAVVIATTLQAWQNA